MIDRADRLEARVVRRARISSIAGWMPATAAFTLLSSFAVSHAASPPTLTARGNEPGWRIDISTKNIVFNGQSGETFTIEPAPPRVAADGADTYSATIAGRPFTLMVSDKLCADTMSGMPYPKTATLILGKQILTGCAGEAASLLHGDWQVWKIGGTTIVPRSAPTLSFDPDGSIHGNASCNRFFGRFVLTGESLSISETGTSRMTCDQPLMDQERNLLKAFPLVHLFEAVSKDEIRFLGGDDRSLLVVGR